VSVCKAKLSCISHKRCARFKNDWDFTHLPVRAADGMRVNVNTAVSVSGRAAVGLEHSRKSKD